MKQLYKYNNKTVARKAFEAGETIIIVPNKTSPNNCWGIDLKIQKDMIANNIANQTFGSQGFDFTIDRYTQYNCNYESGYYVSYYVEV